ncbi:MAG: type IV pilus modification PilV family protein [Terriglobales bacterium]
MHSTRPVKNGRRGRQAGLSMVELLVAMLVLAVGMMGSMILVRTAIVNNNRNKLDTTATALAQMVLEQIESRQATTATNITINDCAGVARTINPNGLPGPAGAGALLIQSGFNAANIDFSQDFTALTPTNYAMQYITCGPANQQVTYEIRWNVTTMTGFTKLVTVSARKQIATNTNALPFFSVPVTLRGIAGQ